MSYLSNLSNFTFPSPGSVVELHNGQLHLSALWQVHLACACVYVCIHVHIYVYVCVHVHI